MPIDDLRGAAPSHSRRVCGALAVLAVTGVAACAPRPAPPPRAASDTNQNAVADTGPTRTTQEPFVGGAARQEADPLVGVWDLVRLVSGPGAAPFHLSVRVDSVRNGMPFGALLHLFVGDVAADPGGFGPLGGDVATDSVTLLIPRRESPGPGITIRAQGSGGRLTITVIVLGTDTVRMEDGGWRLVRR
jgi:hypothetical protein